MIFRFFRKFRPAPQPMSLYKAIVEQARQPQFYANWGVPDTMTGRFDMLALHMFLFTHSIGKKENLRELGQEVFDIFFKDLDASLREIGIGDQTVPKRLKKMANSFYGQVSVYEEPLQTSDAEALANALERNLKQGDDELNTMAIAQYMIEQHKALGEVDEDALLRGVINFSDNLGS